MSREAIESFVDEIRDDLPKLRRAFAIMHACLDDRAAFVEAHRLTHSLKGTAALVGVGILSQIADQQEQLLERLIDGRLMMDDQLRDTLERLADITERFADGLLAGTVPEDRLLSEAVDLCRRHHPNVGHVFNVPVHEEHVENVLHEPMVVSGLTELSDWDVFRIDATGHLRVLVEQLETYRSDLTRWDVLSDVCRRVGSLKQAACAVGLMDFAELAEHAENLLQRVLDRSVPPSEQTADFMQGCVDALEERLERPLDASMLQQLHERIEQLCEVEPPDVLPARESDDARQLAELTDSAVESSDVFTDTLPRNASKEVEVSSEFDPSLARQASLETAVRVPTSPESVELDDRSQLNEEMLEVFNEEAEDHLRLIYAAFADLEKNPSRMSAVQDVRRSAHTIKGAAGSVGLRLVSKLSHRMEDLLERLFTAQQPVSTSTLALLYDTTDALQDLVHGNYAAEGMRGTVSQLYDSYDVLLQGSGARGQASDEPGREPEAESREPLSVSPAEVSETSETTEPTIVDSPGFADDISRNALASGSQSNIAAEPGASALPLMELPEVAIAAPSVIKVPVAIEPATPSELVVNDVLPMLEAWNRLAEPVSVPPPQTAESLADSDEYKRQGESLRVPLARLDSLMREVGELIINRSAFEQRMADFARCVDEMQRSVTRMRSVAHDLDAKYGVGALGGRRALWGDGASLLPGGRRWSGSAGDEFDALELDRYSEFHLLSRSLAESTTDLGTVGNELRNLMGDFDQLLNRQGRLSRDTQDRLMRIRLVPLATLAAKLHRTVRVVAGQQHKDVEFLIQGGDTELDKQVLDELADPLMHILRNAVDHGLEAADGRRAANKPERATIRLQAFSQGTQVVIRVSDDGAGLNFNAIRETAARHGLVAASDVANLNEEELAAFLFLPGFSTARTVSEVSGRGVGMDIVRDKVQKLKGTVSVDSQAGEGTTFTIRLPMTLAVTRALLVHASHETFALPMQSVVQILRLERKQIEKLGPSPVIRLGEEALPLVYLSERLRLRAPADKTSATLPVLVLAAGDQKVAIAVEKILAGRDVVVKTLGSHLRKVKGLIGATLMGDGSVVPILDAADLVGHSGTVTRPRSMIPAPHHPVRRDETPLLMVVDDSVSVRRVMTNLLKNSGWQVLDAKDGLDALEKLQQAERQPDLFLLDIEMPRMDGYELLTSLRSQAEHRETPIVMVTSRAGDKHRQKATQLGATDYIVKPYQDDELLSLLRRLLAAQRELVLI
ncbi:MAG: Hpt domain-containing protein [Planctomycetaceae bacterium]|nr:Hpt domain-containing protein [Planctomycetaceae bacterium]